MQAYCCTVCRCSALKGGDQTSTTTGYHASSAIAGDDSPAAIANESSLVRIRIDSLLLEPRPTLIWAAAIVLRGMSSALCHSDGENFHSGSYGGASFATMQKRQNVVLKFRRYRHCAREHSLGSLKRARAIQRPTRTPARDNAKFSIGSSPLIHD
jgi:hypothetical protein